VEKIRVIKALRPAYQAGDKEELLRIAREDIPLIAQKVQALEDAHRMLWERDFKRNGWEVLALRYGAVCGRLHDVANAIERYVSGELETLCELEEEPLNPDHGKGYAHYISPMYII